MQSFVTSGKTPRIARTAPFVTTAKFAKKADTNDHEPFDAASNTRRHNL
ncbi:hypothetical protein KOR42_36780 [Thalassoglobus neptunius]|uniref:Uncharacterized protein n=2 Tax=Thalassoglobus neptunius TaxID=1938619 RepID=A0A5C5WGS8_9PLAN|nr:hypothetical protein KOR42_36780 [Thalassoglobus neptunius]